MPDIQDPARLCIICQKRQYERAQVCQADRTRLPHILTDIEELHAQLPLALAKQQSAGQRVTGSREAPVPISLDVVDLAAGARNGGLTEQAAKHPGDQIGQIAVASILDQWVRDWRDEMAFAQSLPVPTVPELARWLRDRCEWACDRHPAIDEFAAEMRKLRAVLRGQLGLIEPDPEFCNGVVCKACDHFALYRTIDGKYGVVCDECGMLYTDEEFTEWVALVEADAKQRVKAGELELQEWARPERKERTQAEVHVAFPDWVGPDDERKAA